MKVTGVATQGREEANQWVTAFYVLYSSDGIKFAKVKDWWDVVKVSIRYNNQSCRPLDIIISVNKNRYALRTCICRLVMLFFCVLVCVCEDIAGKKSHFQQGLSFAFPFYS